MAREGRFRQVSPWLLEQPISEQSLVQPFLLVGFSLEMFSQSPSQVAAALKDAALSYWKMAQDMELQIRDLVPGQSGHPAPSDW